MRWFRIDKAEIPLDVRQTCERNGVMGMQLALANSAIGGGGVVLVDGRLHTLSEAKAGLAGLWLSEQFQRAERKETWSLVMEIAITFFVGFELAIEIYRVLRPGTGG